MLALYEALRTHIPDALVVTDSDGRVIHWNEGAESILGYAAAEGLGRTLLDLVVTPDRADEHHRLVAAVHTDGRARAEAVMRCKDGSLVHVDVLGHPIEDVGPGYVLWSVRDVTPLKVRRGASQMEARYGELLDSMPDGVVAIEETGHILLTNERLGEMFGHTRQELIGQDLECLIPARYRTAHAAHRFKYFGEPRARAMGAGLELLALHRDGSEFPVEISLSPLETESGTLVMAAIRDIRERKRMEHELKKKNGQLERANETKVQFLASMSHELRTPLNAIIGFTGTLLMRLAGPLNVEQEKQLHTVRSAAEHLLALINDLLDITRIESGQAKLHPEPTSCRQMATDVAEQIRPLADAKGLSLRLDLPLDDQVIETDRRALHQVLLNLLSNAVKYTDRGGIDVQVSHAAEVGARTVQFSVRDTGIGISNEDRDLLFRAFSQLGEDDGTARPGAGLGLYLSARLAKLLGGRINLESTPGVGSVFTLILPLA